MKFHIVAAICFMAVLTDSGCATRRYVRQQVRPLREQTEKAAAEDKVQDAQIAELQGRTNGTNSSLLELSQAVKKQGALTADLSELITGSPVPPAPGSEAAAKAMAKMRGEGSGGGRAVETRVISTNLTDYRQEGDALVVTFGNASTRLSASARQALDDFAVRAQRQKGFLVTVEGFTDARGSHEGNLTLSRGRAEAVVAYLVSERSIPLYRVHEAGLGSEKPVDSSRSAEGLAKNRRVEVKLYTLVTPR